MKPIGIAKILIVLFSFISVILAHDRDISNVTTKEIDNKQYICVETDNSEKLFFEEIGSDVRLNVWISIININIRDNSKTTLDIVWDTVETLIIGDDTYFKIVSIKLKTY